MAVWLSLIQGTSWLRNHSRSYPGLCEFPPFLRTGRPNTAHLARRLTQPKRPVTRFLSRIKHLGEQKVYPFSRSGAVPSAFNAFSMESAAAVTSDASRPRVTS